MTTAYAISYALLAPTIAALAHAVPRKQLMIAGLGCFVAANLATAIAPTFTLAIIARIGAGLGAAMYAPAATGTAAMIVPPEKRGFALAVVLAGLTSATALGSPIGAMIGGFGDWRFTMVFVSALGAAAALGIGVLLKRVPMPPAVSLLRRIAPLGDPRVSLTVLTTMLAMGGIFTVYTYFSVVFDRILTGGPLALGGLLVAWGLAGTVANLVGGHWVDRIGTQRVLIGVLVTLVIDMALMPWAGAGIWTGATAIVVWGAAGWAIQAPQQHRLSGLNPSLASVLLGLNTTGTYFGVTIAGLTGAYGLSLVGAHRLPYVGLVLVAGALVSATLAQFAIDARKRAVRLADGLPV
jgi:predicted MFS family arabinose efflux permease